MSWYADDVRKVEIQFDGSTWINVSAYVIMQEGITISRGRDDETGDALNPSTLTLTLANDDGRFSPDLSTSPYYPYVVEGVAIRVSMLANGSYVPRFWGTIQSWSVTILDASAKSSECAVTATGLLGGFPSYTFRQAADEVVRNITTAMYHWPLRDSDAPISAIIGDATLSSNGKDGLGEGAGLLALEEGTDNHPKFISSSAGLQLTSSALGLAPPWSVALVILSAPTASCDIFTAGNWTVSWDSTGANFYSSSGGTSFTFGTPAGFPVVIALSNAYDFANSRWQAAFGCYTQSGRYGSYTTFSPGAYPIAQIVVNPTLSGGATWTAGHLMVFASDQVLAHNDLAGMLDPRIPTSASAASQISAWAGGPTITGATVGACTLPNLGGRDAADALASLVTGMGARLVEMMDGTLRWIAFPPSAAAVALPAGAIDPDLTWQTSDVGWMSECTVTWPDGTSYTATRSDGARQTGPEIEGVHATKDLDKSYVTWLVSTANTKARLSTATFDLASLTTAQQATLCGVTVGSRITLTGLPSIMPASQTLIVEGITEAVDIDSWKLTFKTSPDIYTRLVILDDPVQGVLDAGFLLAP